MVSKEWKVGNIFFVVSKDRSSHPEVTIIINFVTSSESCIPTFLHTK